MHSHFAGTKLQGNIGWKNLKKWLWNHWNYLNASRQTSINRISSCFTNKTKSPFQTLRFEWILFEKSLMRLRWEPKLESTELHFIGLCRVRGSSIQISQTTIEDDEERKVYRSSTWLIIGSLKFFIKVTSTCVLEHLLTFLVANDRLGNVYRWSRTQARILFKKNSRPLFIAHFKLSICVLWKTFHFSSSFSISPMLHSMNCGKFSSDHMFR